MAIVRRDGRTAEEDPWIIPERRLTQVGTADGMESRAVYVWGLSSAQVALFVSSYTVKFVTDRGQCPTSGLFHKAFYTKFVVCSW